MLACFAHKLWPSSCRAGLGQLSKVRTGVCQVLVASPLCRPLLQDLSADLLVQHERALGSKVHIGQTEEQLRAIMYQVSLAVPPRNKLRGMRSANVSFWHMEESPRGMVQARL